MLLSERSSSFFGVFYLFCFCFTSIDPPADDVMCVCVCGGGGGRLNVSSPHTTSPRTSTHTYIHSIYILHAVCHFSSIVLLDILCRIDLSTYSFDKDLKKRT